MNKFIDIHEYLSLLKNKKTLCVKDYPLSKNGVINRHDVDFSLDLAYKLSRYEVKYNIKATYYLLITSDLYNIFSKENRRLIEQMISDGFEIGLHFDPTVYGNLDENLLLEKMNEEINLIEKIFKIKIVSYSMHNPSLSGQYLENKRLINAYNSDIFSTDCYLSDSSFSFRGKEPLTFLQGSKDKLIQFLTHPVHLFSGMQISYEKPMNIIINNYYKKLNLIWSVNEVYSKQKEKYIIKLGK